VSRVNFFAAEKNDAKVPSLYSKEQKKKKKNQRLDIIERELKKIVIAKLHESNNP
jgi:tetrahydromethanopterin S-methyltransferase subunit G